VAFSQLVPRQRKRPAPAGEADPTSVPPTVDPYAAQAAVQEHTPPGWYVGQPGYEERYHQRSMHAFDTTEMPADGKRSGEWTAVGRSELHCLGEMARWLAEIKAGSWPE